MDKEKKPVPEYRLRMKGDTSDELYVRILAHLTKNKLYRDPTYTTRQLAKDLNTNMRYISAAVGNNSGNNYSNLVNSFRLRDACHMLRSSRYARFTAEEIGLLSGFASRQAFYKAFSRVYDMTPRAYRLSKSQDEDAAEEK